MPYDPIQGKYVLQDQNRYIFPDPSNPNNMTVPDITRPAQTNYGLNENSGGGKLTLNNSSNNLSALAMLDEAGINNLSTSKVEKPSALDTAKGFAGQAYSQFSNNMAQSNAADYQNDLQNYGATRPAFDPYSDSSAPTLDEYMQNMPSATGSLLKGTLGGEALGKDTGGSNFALGLLSGGTSYGFKDKKQASYIMGKSGERALEGTMAAGWVGAIVGGLEGIVEGALTWNKASDQDKKNAKIMQDQYKKELKAWQENRQKITESKNAAYEQYKEAKTVALLNQSKADKEKKKAERSASIDKHKADIVSALTTAMKFKNSPTPLQTAWGN